MLFRPVPNNDYPKYDLNVCMLGWPIVKFLTISVLAPWVLVPTLKSTKFSQWDTLMYVFNMFYEKGPCLPMFMRFRRCLCKAVKPVFFCSLASVCDTCLPSYIRSARAVCCQRYGTDKERRHYKYHCGFWTALQYKIHIERPEQKKPENLTLESPQ